jgi:choline dehydrogenase-like flavoprotein
VLSDARSVPADTVVRGDVCIIGAGPAGISMARAMRGQALRVVLLESGSFWPHPAAQALYEGHNVGRHYFPLDGCRVRTFGGSTQRWGGWCRSLDEDDFHPRPWVPGSGWPIGRQDLARHYRRARELCQLVVTEGEIDAGPPLPGRPRLPLTHTGLTTVVYQFSPPTRFGQTYRADLARANSVHVYLFANVVGLEGGEHGGPITAARVRTLAGTGFRVEAKVFVLATGGIENPRLLLASHDARPAGVGNENDLVGRFFMEHLHVRLGCFVPSRADTDLSLYVEGLRNVRRPLGALTVAPAARRAQHLYGFTAVFFPPSRWPVRYVLHRQGQSRDPWSLHAASISYGGVLGFGLRVMDGAIRHAYQAQAAFAAPLPWRPPGRQVYEIMGRGEQTPLPDSRVILGRDRDALGMPRVALDWRIAPGDLSSITTSLQAIGRSLQATGLGRVHLPNNLQDGWANRITGSWHHMGTTRMDADPRLGVVDAQCRVHSVPNLYIAGSSVFPTGGYANPTLTIIALALRLADHIVRRLTRATPVALTAAATPP